MQGTPGGEDPPLPQLSLVSPSPLHSGASWVLVGKALPALGPRLPPGEPSWPEDIMTGMEQGKETGQP